MPYYVRVLSPSTSSISGSELSLVLQSALLTVQTGSDDQWEQLLLTHGDGRGIAVIERNEVSDGSLAEEEIAEFIEEVGSLKPIAAGQWLINYLRRVKAIYAFQILHGVDEDNGWREISAVKEKLWSRLGGIFQADGEGFSNEDGYHIVWQFSKQVAGRWWMGVINKDGSWTHFQMELGDSAQREKFLRGEVPDAVKLAE